MYKYINKCKLEIKLHIHMYSICDPYTQHNLNYLLVLVTSAQPPAASF